MKLFRSFGFALNGLKTCFASETNFKIHVILGIVVILLGFMFGVSAEEWLAIIFCMAFVLAMEALNTSIEKLSNLVQSEIHPGIKAVKDVAAGAVLIAAIASLVTGCIIFLPKIILFLKSL